MRAPVLSTALTMLFGLLSLVFADDAVQIQREGNLRKDEKGRLREERGSRLLTNRKHQYVDLEDAGKAYTEEEKEGYWAMCSLMHDEEDVAEWVEYHLRLGASKIFIYDNESDPPLSTYLEEFIARGEVDVTVFKKPVERLDLFRIPHNDCLHRNRHKYTWLSYSDADEYIVVTNPTRSIPDILRDYEGYASVSLVWRTFGSSGHVEKPDKPGVIANYWRCHPDTHVKSISQPKYIEEILNTHFPDFDNGAVRVNMLREPLIGSTTTSQDEGGHGLLHKTPDYRVYDLMYINHYNTRYVNRYINKKFSGYKAPEGFNSSGVRDKASWTKALEGGGTGLGNTRWAEELDLKDGNCTTLQMPATYLSKAPYPRGRTDV